MPVEINLTTDHQEIRRWAEGAGGRPVQMVITAADTSVAVPRIEFDGGPPSQKLEAISWDDWFAKFDEAGLALLYQAREADGSASTFNKLVQRDQA